MPPTFRMSIWYRASREDSPQVETLTEQQVEEYVRPEVGFMADMLYLKGEGVRKLTLEVVDHTIIGKPTEATLAEHVGRSA